MKNLLDRIDAFPAQLTKWQSTNNRSKIECVIAEISSELAPVIGLVPTTKKNNVSQFLVCAQSYFSKNYDVFDPILDRIPALAAKLFFFPTFILIVDRQIELTKNLKSIYEKAPDILNNDFCKQFMKNMNLMHAWSRDIPADVLDDKAKRQIRFYVSLYFEYLSDHGWTPAMSEPTKEEIDNKIQDHHQPLSKKDCDKMNFIEFMRFIADIVSPYASDYHTGLDQTLQHLMAFCSSLKYSATKEIISNNIEMLCAAIKTDDVMTISRIVTAEPTILTKQCPDGFDINEISFTPLMLAAKYCQKPESIYSRNNEGIAQGLFCLTKNKNEQLIHMKVKANGCNPPYNTYTSLMIAARWGRADVFKYFITLAGASAQTPKNLKMILQAVCHTALPYTGSNNPVVKVEQSAKRDAIINQLITLLQAGNVNNLETCFPNKNLPSEVKAKLAVLLQEPSPAVILTSITPLDSAAENPRTMNKKREREVNEEAKQVTSNVNRPKLNPAKNHPGFFAGTAIIPDLEPMPNNAESTRKAV
jgi:hypothetical protein